MAEYVVFTAKTQAEALEKASSELGVPKEKLRYDILSHGSTGIFGLVRAKKAKIRVKVPGAQNQEQPAAEKKAKKGKAEASQASQASEAQESEAADGKKRRGRAKKQSSGRKSRSRKKKEESPESPAPETPQEEASAETPSEAASETENSPEAALDAEEASENAAANEPQASRHRQPLADGEALESAARKVEEDLRFFCAYLLDDCSVSAEPAPGGHVFCKVEGPDTGLLIGRKGQTLEGVQHLLEMMVNRGLESKVRVRVDAGGYLARREENLARMAKRLAEKVKRSGRPFSLSPMSSYDRRIVHTALKEEKELRTISKGTGSLRKLIILPKSMSNKKLPPDFDAPVAHEEEEELA